MKKITTLILILLFSSLVLSQTYQKVKIHFTNKDDIKTIVSICPDLDHYSLEKDNSLGAFLSSSDVTALRDMGFRIEILIDDWQKHYIETNQYSESQKQSALSKTSSNFGVTGFDYGSMGGYYTLEEVYSKLDEMYSGYPALISQKESIGKTIEDKDIFQVKISDNPDINEDEPEVLYTSLHHAREPESMMQMIYFMFYLLENYNVDQEVKYLVNNREMYFIPVVNPDGYYHNQTSYPAGGGMWRKNRFLNADSTIGVDLNRNYGPHEYWNAANGGSSTSAGDNTYRGTEPFSENETAAIRAFLYSHNIRACLNYHTYSNLLIYPYGALGVETPDSLTFRKYAQDMTQFNGYVYGTDIQTVGYTTRGNSDDYMYDGEVNLKGKIFTMTPEVGSFSDGFWPHQSRILPLAEENVFPNLYYAWIVGGYVTIKSIEFDKEYFNSGDVVNVKMQFKNIGMDISENIKVLFESADGNSDIIVGEYLAEGFLPSETHIIDSSLFQFRIKENYDIDQIGLKIKIYQEDVLMATNHQTLKLGTPTIVFIDSSANMNNWVTYGSNSQWEVSTSDYYSQPSSFTDSPAGKYSDDASSFFELKEQIDLSGISKPVLSFWTKFEIERGWDYAQVQISSNGGNEWTAVGGRYSNPGAGSFQPDGEPVYDGNQLAWVKEEISLSAFEGNKILIRFMLKSDSYLQLDGIYLDDIAITSYLIRTDLSSELNTNEMNFNLEQNFPNPFNPSTRIKFTIPKFDAGHTPTQQNTILKIYDVLGREISTLVNDHLVSGNYEVEFNSAFLGYYYYSSGIYFYKLTVGANSSTKKMILLR